MFKLAPHLQIEFAYLPESSRDPLQKLWDFVKLRYPPDYVDHPAVVFLQQGPKESLSDYAARYQAHISRQEGLPVYSLLHQRDR